MPATKKRRPAPAPSAISGQLREIISGRGLTAYSVAQAAEVSPSVVSRFLSRERGLTLETFDAIAGALGLRLVETGRGRGRPTSRSTRPARARPEVADGEGPGEDGEADHPLRSEEIVDQEPDGDRPEQAEHDDRA